MRTHRSRAALLIVVAMIVVAIYYGKGRNGGSSDSDLAAIESSRAAIQRNREAADAHVVLPRMYRWRAPGP